MKENDLEVLEKIFPYGFVAFYKVEQESQYQLAMLSKGNEVLELAAMLLSQSLTELKKELSEGESDAVSDEGV